MHKKSTLLSVSVFFLLFIGVSDYGYGCHRPGSTDGGGCGKVDGEGPNTFKVHLAGAFVFGPPTTADGVLVVVLNQRRTIARSDDNKAVYMSRPDSNQEQIDWDGVFGTCPVLRRFLEERQLEEPQLEEPHVLTLFSGAADWRISINTGEIRLKLPHMLLTDSVGEIEEVDLHLQLIGDLDLGLVVDFPPANEGDFIQISLDRFDIRGPTVDIHPREKCVLDVMPFPGDSPLLTICAAGDPCQPPFPSP